MKNDKLVSVIIPCYNHEKYIESCVLSVLNQSYGNIEVIIGDDCSSDGSREVIDGIADDRVKKFFYDANMGTVRSLNFLMSKCGGEYIAVLGSDDLWQKDKLEKQIAYLEEHQNAGACFTLAEVIDENSIVYEKNPGFDESIFASGNLTQAQWLKLFFETGNRLCHSSLVIRKKVQDEIGNYNLAYRQLHDYEMWVRLINEYPIHVIDEKLVGYRFIKGAKSVSSGADKNTVRLINESFCLIYDMIDKMRPELFCEAFLNGESLSKSALKSEKLFTLLNYSLCGRKNVSLALRYASENLDEEAAEELEKRHALTLNGFYEKTGNTDLIYPYAAVKGDVGKWSGGRLKNAVKKINNKLFCGKNS